MFESLRGQILGFLYRVYPEEIEYVTILSVFYEYHKEKNIKRSLQYLVDKGYVVYKQLPHPIKKKEKVHLYKITPKGIDLIEGNLEDKTIFLEEEED